MSPQPPPDFDPDELAPWEEVPFEYDTPYWRLPPHDQAGIALHWDVTETEAAERFDAMSDEDQIAIMRSYPRPRPGRGNSAHTSTGYGTGRPPAESDANVMIQLAQHRAAKGSAILDAPEAVESVWGDGHRCLWAKGEPFLLCGPDGVGKTTIAQQLVLHLAGAIDGPFLGLHVQPAGRVLYLACDRPTQALRSFRRMVGDADREILDENLTIWRGPLPFNLASEPRGLVELAQHFDAMTVVIDSIKDVASDLSKEESGLGLNTAFQNAVAEGIEVAGLHHQRKQQTGAAKPRHLSDVYGSRWLTAGAGSVAMLWADAGDLVVDLDHLKQPDEPVGPLKVIHDHVHGVSTIAESTDAFSVIGSANNGMSAAAAASEMFQSPVPTRNEVERARRQLERLTREGKIHKQDGAKGGRAGANAAIYYPLAVIAGGRS